MMEGSQMFSKFSIKHLGAIDGSLETGIRNANSAYHNFKQNHWSCHYSRYNHILLSLKCKIATPAVCYGYTLHVKIDSLIKFVTITKFRLIEPSNKLW